MYVFVSLWAMRHFTFPVGRWRLKSVCIYILSECVRECKKKYMLTTGIEPATVGLLDQCSTNWATRAQNMRIEAGTYRSTADRSANWAMEACVYAYVQIKWIRLLVYITKGSSGNRTHDLWRAYDNMSVCVMHQWTPTHALIPSETNKNSHSVIPWWKHQIPSELCS